MDVSQTIFELLIEYRRQCRNELVRSALGFQYTIVAYDYFSSYYVDAIMLQYYFRISTFTISYL